jgi:putative sigma-54 modulation protein
LRNSLRRRAAGCDRFRSRFAREAPARRPHRPSRIRAENALPTRPRESARLRGSGAARAFVFAWKESLMNLHLTGHHLDITPAIRDYVIAKLERVNRHFDHVIDVSVVLSVDKLRQKVEATVHVRGKDLHVESVDADMYAAIDALADKLDRQVLKYKEQLKDHRTDTAAIDRSAVGSGAEESI